MVSSSVSARFRITQCRSMKTLCSLFLVLLACCEGSFVSREGSLLVSNLSSHQNSDAHSLSNLMSREQVFQMLVTEANISGGRGEKSLGELAGALASLAQVSSSTGNTTADPSTVASLREMVQAFILELVTEHNESQTIVNDLSGFVHCEANLTTGDTTTTTAGATTTDNQAATENCSSCWDVVRELEKLNESCRNNITEWYGEWQENCTYLNGTNRSVSEVQNERCTENWVGTYEDYLERDLQLLAELTYSADNCTSSREHYVNESIVCNNYTSQLVEQIRECLDCEERLLSANTTTTEAPCTVDSDRQQICDDYTTCYSIANSTFVARCSSQQLLSASRKAEYRALMRVNCLLDVLVVDVTQQESTLIGCINTTYSDDAFTIVCGNAPDPTACDPCR